MSDKERRIERRKLLAGLGTGIAAVGALTATQEASASREQRWQPALEPEDAWMDMPGRHRFTFDATSADGAGEAIFFTKNYIEVNKSAYKLTASQLANIVILRHMATIFGYNDSVWAKYGEIFSAMVNFKNPHTKQAPKRNLYDVTGFGHDLPNWGATISGLALDNVQFAVCGLATEKIAGMLASKTNARAAAVHEELAGNLISNGRLVPAGIVAVNRAQERGYALAYMG